MAFAQLTFRESLRDIEVCLRSMQSKLYHMGIRGKISRSTLADANNSKDWRIYADFAQILIHTARDLYSRDPFGVELEETVYALDATTIDLCLSLFPWAKFRKNKAAIKMHTLMDLRGSIPTFVEITTGIVNEMKILDLLIPEPGSFYILDRGYFHFQRLYNLHQSQAYFVIRSKKKIRFQRIYSHEVDKSLGLRCDQTITITGQHVAKDYPEKLRRVIFFDQETNKRLIFFTNNFRLPALTIAQLYKKRWEIELFFKWIKQHLRIKAFYGTSENAVKTQIWIAISVYVLIAIVKKRLKTDHNLYTFLQILSVVIFEKIPFSRLMDKEYYKEQNQENLNQLQLFN
jgi:hypothetical protein